VRYNALLFDLDGTLIDSIADIAHSFNEILSAHDFPTHPVDAYRHFIGDGVLELGRRALPQSEHSDGILRQCVAEYRAVYANNWNKLTRPYAGIPELLRALITRGMRLAVVSNKPHTDTVKCVTHFFGDDSFDPILGQSDAHPKKPDPSGARWIADQLGLAPAECLFAGDSGVDMQTASAAGMFAVGVLWGFRDADELTRGGASALVERPEQLEALVAGEG
jgi:phosphoglycolate phosphatase